MQFKASRAPSASHRTDAFVLFRGEKRKKGAVPDPKLKKATDVAIRAGEFKGAPNETLLLHGGRNGRRLLLVGLGSSKAGADELRTAAAAAARVLAKHRLQSATFLVPTGRDATARAGAIAEGAGLALYRFDELKSKRDPAPLRKLEIVPESGEIAGLRKAITHAEAVVDAVAFTRDLGNLPANIATPTYLARRARQLSGRGVTVRVHDRAAIKRMRMGAFTAVAQGSATQPRLIELRYRGGGPRKPTIALVGKGVTFDTGGISIKPASKMEDMKFDMCGAGAVLGTMMAVRALQPKINVHAVVPAADNMPGGKAYRPGDIVTARNKKTIEVINTDAEGRLLLCDALAYAAEKKPDCVIDIATLTGACVVALADVASGLFSNDDTLRGQLESAGQATGELAWPLPLHPTYGKMMKSVYADLKNSGGRWGGACTAAAFLQNFVSDLPWAHIDIAGMAWTEKNQGYHTRGATGYGVRLLLEFLERRAEA